jgi:hypothetical protein
VSETNSGAVLNGKMIGSRATIVSAIVSRKMAIGGPSCQAPLC